MTTVIEEFVAKLGWEIDPKGLKTFTKQVSDLKGFAMTGARYARNFAIGFTGFFNVTALAHTRLTKLGEAVGLTTETLEALENSLSGTGIRFETLIQSSARLGTVLGRMKIGAASKEVTDAMKPLGLSIKDLKDLSPEDAFIKVADSIVGLEDAQMAMAVASALLGEEASRAIGHYRSLGVTVSQQLMNYRRVSLVNEESRAGTARYSEALLTLKDILLGISRYIAGMTGHVMAPYVETLQEWLIVNKELVRTNIIGFIRGIATAVRHLVSFSSFIMRLIESVGGLGNALKLVAGIILSIKLAPLLLGIQGLIATAPTLGAAFASAGAAVSASWLPMAAILGSIFLIVDDIMGALSGKRTLGGRLEKQLGISEAMHSLTAFIARMQGVDVEEFYLRLTQDGLGAALSYMFGDLKNRTIVWLKGLTDLLNEYWVKPAIRLLMYVPDKIYAGFVKLINKLGPYLSRIPGINIPKIKENSFSQYFIEKTKGREPVGAFYKTPATARIPIARAPQAATVSYPWSEQGSVTINQTTNVETNASAERIAALSAQRMERALTRVRRNARK